MRKRIRRLCTWIIALTVIAAVGIGGTYAVNVHQAQQENNLISRNEKVEIQETFPDPTVTAGATKTKAVAFENTGTAAAFVRVAYTESWETSTELLSGATSVTKNWTTDWTADWELKSDGWYYYKKVLPAGQTTAQILTGVTFPGTVPTGASYNLNFTVETVQCSDEAALNTAATTAAFGRSASVGGATIANGAVTGGTVTWS